MKIANDEHERQPWKVHALADDFELEDVWRLPIRGDQQPGRDFTAFADTMTFEAPQAGVVGMLFRLRLWLGEVFGWDGEERLDIPDSAERSVIERLSEELAAKAPPFDPALMFQMVYDLPEERLLEISNSTVHALMHLGWVKHPDGNYGAQMAVYAKPRGAMGRAYMALIKPFRLFIVYPALMKVFRDNWLKHLRAVQLAPVG